HLYIGQKIQIPGLPEPSTIPYSIQISVGKRRLTLYNNGKFVKIYPIAVGKMLTNTPIGDYVIVNRQINPGGPYGVMWLSLSKQGYGIHGTNDPSSIGKAVSKGCVRMYNRDVLQLAQLVPNGTRVSIRP
ncbi:MAG: L,D-transpeptidase, partial [Bacillus sp. (in: Bacteria)]|nr:L,D-transpeptidase [Bacillus sp. (in: firmicutes)]